MKLSRLCALNVLPSLPTAKWASLDSGLLYVLRYRLAKSNKLLVIVCLFFTGRAYTTFLPMSEGVADRPRDLVALDAVVGRLRFNLFISLVRRGHSLLLNGELPALKVWSASSTLSRTTFDLIRECIAVDPPRPCPVK